MLIKPVLNKKLKKLMLLKEIKDKPLNIKINKTLFNKKFSLIAIPNKVETKDQNKIKNKNHSNN
jgi:hypothetical protein